MKAAAEEGRTLRLTKRARRSKRPGTGRVGRILEDEEEKEEEEEVVVGWTGLDDDLIRRR